MTNGVVMLDYRNRRALFDGCLLLPGQIVQTFLRTDTAALERAYAGFSPASGQPGEDQLAAMGAAFAGVPFFKPISKASKEALADFYRYAYEDLQLFSEAAREISAALSRDDGSKTPIAVSEHILFRYRLKSSRFAESAPSDRAAGPGYLRMEKKRVLNYAGPLPFAEVRRYYFDSLFDLLAFDWMSAIQSQQFPNICPSCGEIFFGKRDQRHRCGEVTSFRLMRGTNLLLSVGTVVFIVAAAIVLAKGIGYYLDRQASVSEYDELSSAIEEVQQSASGDTDGQFARLMAYAKLYKQNNDLVGWIRIDNTVIDYPVLKSEQDDYYLTHGFSKKKNASGAIYVPNQCSMTLPSDNIVLYGHNMRDGSMFADLTKYLKKSFWEANRVIHFDTLTEVADYEVIRVLKTVAYGEDIFPYYTYTTFSTEGSLQAFFAETDRYAVFDTGIDPVFGDKFITLSTCEYSQKDGRLVVIARKISGRTD